MPELIWTHGDFRILPLHTVRLDKESAVRKRDRLASLIRAGKPALILLVGDTFRDPTDAEEARRLLSVFLAPARESGIPFAFTFGEGERRCGLSEEVLYEVFSSVPGSLLPDRAERTDGFTDGTLPVTGTDGTDPLLILRLFDTHAETTAYERDYGSPGRSRLPYPLYTPHYMDGVRFNQTAWFDGDHERIEARYGKKIPELFFFHTPTPEHAQLVHSQDRGGFDGVIREERKCQTVNGGISMAAAESRTVLAILCGHEEKNDYFARWAGMLLGVEPAFDRGAWIVSVEKPADPTVRITRL